MTTIFGGKSMCHVAISARISAPALRRRRWSAGHAPLKSGFTLFPPFALLFALIDFTWMSFR
jgi:hypothetical protein